MITTTPVSILLVEDSQEDIDLTTEALKESKLTIDLSVVNNGEDAMHYLRREGKYQKVPRPDLILLDLNLPRKNGNEVLQELKSDAQFRQIPVVILTTSRAESDVLRAYQNNVNCYVCKPLNLEKFVDVVRTIENFWFTIVKLPGRSGDELCP